MKTITNYSLEVFYRGRGYYSSVTRTLTKASSVLTLKRFLLASVALALIAITPGANAQVTSGDLVGIVTDPTGAAVPGAQVTAVEESTGVRAIQTTEANGQFRFNNLHIGKYDLTITASGFTSSSLKGVAIELNKTATQNVTLAVGQLSQNVEVVEASETIDTSTAQIQTNFNSKLAADLPLAGLAAGGVLNLSL